MMQLPRKNMFKKMVAAAFILFARAVAISGDKRELIA
tara:strand:+ start:1588 stop:1698 length:111 start_codon:yes stop_codon:yes gene_type:complete